MPHIVNSRDHEVGGDLDFKARCLALLEDVARTGKPLLVTKRGKPLTRLTAADHSQSSSPQDTLRHSVETLGDVIVPAIPVTARDATQPHR